MDPLRLTLHGFSLAEKLDLEKVIGSENVSASQPVAPGSRHRNLALYDVIVSLGPSVIALLGIWLSKNRRTVRQDEVTSLVLPDGTTQSHRIVYAGREESTDAEVVKQVASIARNGGKPPSKVKMSKVVARREVVPGGKVDAPGSPAKRKSRGTPRRTQ